MRRCWNHEPTQRPKFEDLQKELDAMLSADQRDQYIQINSVDEPYCKMFPAQSTEVWKFFHLICADCEALSIVCLCVVSFQRALTL